MIQIRTYKTTDKSDILDLLRENTPEFFSKGEEKDLISYLQREIEEYFIVELNNETVGCGGINYKENKTVGVISWDIISSNHQGQGIGSKLLSFRLSKLIEDNQIEKIIVRTSQHVFPFYEKQGFELIQITKDYWDKGFDLYHMEINKIQMEQLKDK